MEVKTFTGTAEEVKTLLESEQYTLSARFFSFGNTLFMIQEDKPEVEEGAE